MIYCRDDELAETSDPVTLVYDSATRMFWRNVNARSGNAPVNKLGRKPARYDIPADVSVPPAVELLGEVMLRPQLHLDAHHDNICGRALNAVGVTLWLKTPPRTNCATRRCAEGENAL